MGASSDILTPAIQQVELAELLVNSGNKYIFKINAFASVKCMKTVKYH